MLSFSLLSNAVLNLEVIGIKVKLGCLYFDFWDAKWFLNSLHGYFLLTCTLVLYFCVQLLISHLSLFLSLNL